MHTHPVYGYQMVDREIDQKELDGYYRSAYVNPTPMYDPERIIGIISAFFRFPGRVLDIGCGDGLLLETFEQHGWIGVGVEPGPTPVAAAWERGMVVVQDVLSSAMDRLDEYDLVIMANLLEHLLDPEEAVEQAYSLLRPEGIIYCSVPNDFSPLQHAAVKEMGLPQWWVADAHLNYFSRDSLTCLLEDKGFSVVYSTTDFPMELFLLLGWDYVNSAAYGVLMHERRCGFEHSMPVPLLERLYEALIKLDIGRNVILCARRLL